MNQRASTERALLVATCLSEMGYYGAVGQMLLLSRAFYSDRALWAALALHKGPGGRTRLMHAAKMNNSARAWFLVERGARVGCTSLLDESAMSLACLGGFEAMVCLLVDKAPGEALSARASDGATPLIWASGIGHLGIARLLLLDKGADVNGSTKLGVTALCAASSKGHEGLVRFLTTCHGIDLNAVTASGNTAVTLACLGKHSAVVRCLAEAGAAVAAVRPSDGKTALLLAMQAKQIDTVTVSCLLKHGAGATINAVSAAGDTALSRASAAGNTTLIHLLASHGAGTDVAAAGSAPLLLALNKGHSDAALALIRYGADCGVAENAPLQVAARKGLVDVVRALLQGGASTLAADAGGCTVLHMAARLGSVEIVRALLDGGASCKAADAAGCTALHFAAARGSHECSAPIIALLGARGARASAATSGAGAIVIWGTVLPFIQGTTPLMLAAHSGIVEAAKALRATAHDARARDSQGKTAHDYAGDSKMRACIDALTREVRIEGEDE